MVKRKVDDVDADDAEGVGIPKSDGAVENEKDTPTDEVETEPLTLLEKFAAIRAECISFDKEEIEMKTKAGVKYKIQAHTIEGILSGVRPLLDRYRILLLPELKERSDNGNRCDVRVQFDFIDLDATDDRITIQWAGSGTDNADKGFAKAGTNALKEVLKKVFLITDREDVKSDEDNEEFKKDGGTSTSEAAALREEGRRALEGWADSFRLLLQTARTVAEVKDLERQHREALSNKNLPSTTRAFFAQNIARLKETLPATEEEKKRAAEE